MVQLSAVLLRSSGLLPKCKIVNTECLASNCFHDGWGCRGLD